MYRKRGTIYSYGASINKKIKSEISTNSCLVVVEENKKELLSTIKYILNLNIRIADIVMIQWVRSTYFFISNFMLDLVGTVEK